MTESLGRLTLVPALPGRIQVYGIMFLSAFVKYGIQLLVLELETDNMPPRKNKLISFPEW